MWIVFLLMDNYFLLWVKCCTIIINFIAQIVPAVAIRSSFKILAPVPFRLRLFCKGSSGKACCCLVAQSCPTLCDPVTVTHQAPLSMGFSKQEYWSGLLFPPLQGRPSSSLSGITGYFIVI